MNDGEGKTNDSPGEGCCGVTTDSDSASAFSLRLDELNMRSNLSMVSAMGRPGLCCGVDDLSDILVTQARNPAKRRKLQPDESADW